MKAISEAERKYIRQSCNNGIRNDGRGPLDLRSLSAECDMLPNCNGSSRVSLGNTIDVVCGVKVYDVYIYMYMQ
jgi:exosome complex RNA-binding protein Rrp42 (RNase PH superfamily)